jgi:hypothetical protein
MLDTKRKVHEQRNNNKTLGRHYRPNTTRAGQAKYRMLPIFFVQRPNHSCYHIGHTQVTTLAFPLVVQLFDQLWTGDGV